MSLPDDLSDDELLSAVFDGETPDDVSSTVLGDPEFSARLEAFATIRAEMRDFSVPTSLLDELRAVALTTVDTPESAPPIRLRRRGSTRPWLGAAAAVTVLVASVGFVLARDQTPTPEDATSRPASTSAGAAAAEFHTGASGAAIASDAKTTKAAPAAGPAQLGALRTVEALAAAYRALSSGTGSTATTDSAAAPAINRCGTAVAEIGRAHV